MKNINKLLFIPIFASFFCFLPSCKKVEENSSAINKNGKVILPKKEDIDSFVFIETENELNEIARYDSCCIIVTKEGCSYCDSLYYSFRGNKDSEGKYTNGYIYKTSTIFYVVDAYTYLPCYQASYNQTGSFAKLYPEVSGTPTMLFYDSGKLVNSRTGHFYDVSPNKINRSDDDKNYKNTEKILSKYILNNEYYSLNTLKRIENNILTIQAYYVQSRDEDDDTLGFDTETLDEKINEENDKLIVFTWKRCDDCKEFKNTVIEPFLYNNKKKAYYYEVDGYFLKKRNTDETKKDYGQKIWYEFSNKYHINDIPGYSNVYGKTGATPAIIYYTSTSHTTKTFRNDTDIDIDSDDKLYYKTTIYNEVKNLRSDTSVSSLDSANSTYQKALKELNEKRDSLEKNLLTKFLNEIL